MSEFSYQKISVELSRMALEYVDGCNSKAARDAIDIAVQSMLTSTYPDADVQVSYQESYRDTQRTEIRIEPENKNLFNDVSCLVDDAESAAIAAGDWDEEEEEPALDQSKADDAWKRIAQGMLARRKVGI